MTGEGRARGLHRQPVWRHGLKLHLATLFWRAYVPGRDVACSHAIPRIPAPLTLAAATLGNHGPVVLPSPLPPSPMPPSATDTVSKLYSLMKPASSRPRRRMSPATTAEGGTAGKDRTYPPFAIRIQRCERCWCAVIALVGVFLKWGTGPVWAGRYWRRLCEQHGARHGQRR